MSTFWQDMTSGATSGVFTGIGQLLKDIRTAVTGKSSLDSADQIKLIELAQALELEALKSEMELQRAQAQVNLADAQSSSNFRGGWRPFIGWVCGFGLAYHYLLRPIFPWILTSLGLTVEPMPIIDAESLLTLILGMLGLGGFRTFERVRGMRK